MEAKNCQNCFWKEAKISEYPCLSCGGNMRNWEPRNEIKTIQERVGNLEAKVRNLIEDDERWVIVNNKIRQLKEKLEMVDNISTSTSIGTDTIPEDVHNIKSVLRKFMRLFIEPLDNAYDWNVLYEHTKYLLNQLGKDNPMKYKYKFTLFNPLRHAIMYSDYLIPEDLISAKIERVE